MRDTRPHPVPAARSAGAMTSFAGPPQPAGWQVAFRLLFETSATPVAILDDQRRLVELNAPAQEVVLPCGRDAAGEPAEDAIAVEERERSESDWHELLREGHLSGTRTLVRADRCEIQVFFAAVIEAVAGGRRAIYTLTPRVEAAPETL